MIKRRGVALIVSAAFALSSCATTEGGRPATAMQRAASTCVLSMVGGAIIGAVIGNNTGSGNAGRGAAYGLAAGGLVCVVVLAMSQRDKQAVADLQTESVRTGRAQETVFTDEKGATHRIKAVSKPADPTQANIEVQKYNAAVAADAAARAKREAEGKAAKGQALPQLALYQPQTCRFSVATVDIEGTGRSDMPQQLMCRTADNNWVAVPTTA